MGIPRHPLVANTADQVHNIGNVWCVTLWDVRANLITKHGFAIGNELTLPLVSDGLKLAPANPTFLQARDAIIQADLVDKAGANSGELWTAFAKRGVGANATSPANSTTVGVVENYDIPDALAVGPMAAWAASGTVGGPFPGTNAYTLANSSASPLNWTAAAVQPWLAVAPAGGTLAPGASTTVMASLSAAAATLGVGSYAGAFTFTNTTSGIAQSRAVTLTIELFTAPIASERLGERRGGECVDDHRHEYEPHARDHGERAARRELSSHDGFVGGCHLRALASSAPDVASAPASVTIPGGQASVSFPLTVIDDPLLDGTRSSVISVTAAGYSAAAGAFTVHDDEPGVLTLAPPAAASEGDAPLTATLSVSAPVAADLVVTLASSNAAELQVPATVTIPAGQASVTFPATIIDDTRIDGTTTATITAQVTNWTAGSATVAIADNESTALTVVLPASVREGDGPKTGLVRIGGTLGAPLTIALASDDTSELSVPATVKIAAGNTAVAFGITPVDDALTDGAQPATVNASASGFTAGSANTNVQDNDLHHFVLGPIASPQVPNAPFPVTVTACDVNGAAITNHASAATLSDGGVILALSGWVNGVATVNAAIAAPAQGVVLTADDGAGHTGASTPFDVAVGAVHHFAWAPVASPQTSDNFFPVTITAQDVGNNTVTAFSGPANLKAGVPGTAQFDIGTSTGLTTGYPLNSASHDERTQVIYLASELGGARRITGLALYVSNAPGAVLNAWTIRVKQTTQSSYTTNAVWQSTGWTTVYQSNLTMPGTTW